MRDPPRCGAGRAATMFDAMRADPFDQRALEAAYADLRQRRAALQQAGQEIVLRCGRQGFAGGAEPHQAAARTVPLRLSLARGQALGALALDLAPLGDDRGREITPIATRPIRIVQTALISGVTPRRTWL